MADWEESLGRGYLLATLDRSFHYGTPRWMLLHSSETQHRADSLQATSPFVFYSPLIPLSTWQNYKEILGQSVPGRWDLCTELPAAAAATLDTVWDRLTISSSHDDYRQWVDLNLIPFNLSSPCCSALKTVVIFQELTYISTSQKQTSEEVTFPKNVSVWQVLSLAHNPLMPKTFLLESRLTSRSQISSQRWACQQLLIFSA